MKIIFESREFTPTEKYLMTKSPSIISVKNVEDGSLLEVKGYLHYEDEDQNGKTSHMTSIIGVSNGEQVVWSTQSKTFVDNFIDISEIFEGEGFTIKKLSGVTKNTKRPYVNCDLAQ
jgi:hypothetical protein